MADVAENNSSQLEPKFTELELEHPVEGDITIPGAKDEETDLSTLDEPVMDTIMRDATAVGKKFFHVLYPKQSKSLLKEWDLWGPLILCTLLAILLQWSASSSSEEEDNKVAFSQVFGLVAFGAVAVALNSKLLGGSLSFFQGVCVLGYCILPLVLSLIIGEVLGLVISETTLFISRALLTIIACIWATIASFAFVSDSQPQHRKILALYPICLFYFVISWMVITGV